MSVTAEAGGGTFLIPAVPSKKPIIPIIVREQQQETPYEWTQKDNLALLSAIVKYGENNWPPIIKEMKIYNTKYCKYDKRDPAKPNRPTGWNSEKNCTLQYKRLFEIEIIERSMGNEITNESVCQALLRKAKAARLDELKPQMERDGKCFLKHKEQLQKLNNGFFDNRLDKLCENKLFKQFIAAQSKTNEIAKMVAGYQEGRRRGLLGQTVATASTSTGTVTTPLKIDTQQQVPPPVVAGGPRSPKVSPQLKNLVYTAIAGTQEAGGPLPAPASSPTLSMLLEMPPRGHGQPLPEIPTVPVPGASPKSGTRPETVGKSKEDINAQKAREVEVIVPGLPGTGAGQNVPPVKKEPKSPEKPSTVVADTKVKGEIKIEGASSPALRAQSKLKQEGEKEVDPLIVTIDITESPRTSPNKLLAENPDDVITLTNIPILSSPHLSDSQSTISGSPSSSRAPSALTSPVSVSGAGGTTPETTTAPSLRSGRRLQPSEVPEPKSLRSKDAAAEHTSASKEDKGEQEEVITKSLRRRLITPQKDDKTKPKDIPDSSARVKLDFDDQSAAKGSTKAKTELIASTKKPAAVDFKTVTMKETEQQQQQEKQSVPNLRSRRGGSAVLPSNVSTPGPGRPPSSNLSKSKDEEAPAVSHRTAEEAVKVEVTEDSSDDSDEEIPTGLVYLGEGDEEHEGDESDSVAKATERWVVHGSKNPTTALKRRAESTDDENSNQGISDTSKLRSAARRPEEKPKLEDISERPKATPGRQKGQRGAPRKDRTGETPDKEAADDKDEKRITRARTRTSTVTMTPPVAKPSTSITPHETPTTSAGESDLAAPSRSLRSTRLRYYHEGPSGSPFTMDPPSPMLNYSAPHSPASSTATNPHLDDDKEERTLKKSLLSLHRLVTNLKNAYIFLKTTVPKYSKPRFDESIQKPLDFSVIKKSIDNDTIKSFEVYQTQVCIMFLNHLMYFNEGQELAKQTRKMANETFDIIEDFIRNYNESNAVLWTATSGSERRESRARDLRFSAQFKSSPSSHHSIHHDSSNQPSGSEESHDESHKIPRRKRSEVSPNITDDIRKILPRTASRPTGKTTRQSGV